METLNNMNEKNDLQSETTNKLLLEIVKNQKVNTKNLVKVFMTTIICYTVLLLGAVIGFFVYESQFSEYEKEIYTIEQEQTATTDGGGNATVNGGDISYYGNGKAETDNNSD